MATYTTRTLAEKVMPAAAEANMKSATRTLRKFLRDDLGQGKAVVGKGQRYSLDYTAKEITALKKKFAAWEIEQAEAQKARREALAAKLTAPANTVITTDVEESPVDTVDDLDDDAEGDALIEGPSDEEIAAMLADTDA